MCSASMPDSSMWATRRVITRVLPDPAPASTRQAPSVEWTAWSWARSRPADMGEGKRKEGRTAEARNDTEPPGAASAPAGAKNLHGEAARRTRPACENPRPCCLSWWLPFLSSRWCCAATWPPAGRVLQPAIPGLNAFVLYFALPCMLYRFGASTPIAQLLDPAVAGVYVLCALVMVAASRWRPRASAASAGTTRPSARWWPPFPTPASWACRCWWRCWARRRPGPAIVTIVVDMLVTSSLCIALSRLDGAGTHGVRSGAAQGVAGHGRQPHALVDRAGRAGLGPAVHAARPGDRPWPCWPTPPRPWPCSPSARCWRARR